MNHSLSISMRFKVHLHLIVAVKGFTTYSALEVCSQWMDFSLTINFNYSRSNLWLGNMGFWNSYDCLNFKRGAKDFRFELGGRWL